MLRVSLKSLLSRKLRLTLAVLAIVLGVAFISGAFVLSDTLGARFDTLFRTINANVAVQVQVRENAVHGNERPYLTRVELDRIGAVDGVALASPEVSADGVLPFNERTHKAVQSPGLPARGIGVAQADDPLGLVRVAQGRWPRRPGEIAIAGYTAKQSDAVLDGTLTVYVPARLDASTYWVVGILAYPGDRDTLRGETLVAFTTAEAQQLFYGAEGRYSGASVSAEPGVSPEELQRRVGAVLPPTFQAKTAKEINKEQSDQVKEGLNFITGFLLSFAAVAVFVGAFLIFNTFNILVAQRVRELAMLRALGASRGQIIRAVLVEATAVGGFGSTVGLLLGIGLAIGGQTALTTVLDVKLPGGGLVVSATAVIISYAVGVGVTLISAFVPAVKASSVPPLAAMREIARPDRSLVRLTIAGACLLAPGAGAVGIALAGAGAATTPALGGGVLLCFLGATLLSPLLTRPVAGLLGRLLSWGTASRLGYRNAIRNPRRTAVTAAALMIGVTLVTAVSVLGASFKTSTEQMVSNVLGADVIINTSLQQAPTGEQGFDPRRLAQVRALPDVRQAVAQHAEMATINGQQDVVTAGDIAALKPVLGLQLTSGRLDGLSDNDLVAHENLAKSNHWKVGDTVRIKLTKGGERQYLVAGIYKSTLTGGVLLPESAIRYFAGPLAFRGYVSVDKGADIPRVLSNVQRLMSDFPMVNVTDRSGYVKQENQLIDIALGIFYVLLGLAVLIAVLGIINTLLLSIYERTRELGILRAVGMTRRQVKRMIRVEAVIIALFGCLLGIALGLALGTAITYALIGQTLISAVAVPGMTLAVFTLSAAVAGLVAAWWPSVRASRHNLLAAIAHE